LDIGAYLFLSVLKMYCESCTRTPPSANWYIDVILELLFKGGRGPCIYTDYRSTVWRW